MCACCVYKPPPARASRQFLRPIYSHLFQPRRECGQRLHGSAFRSVLQVQLPFAGDRELHVLISEAKNLKNGHKAFIESQLACSLAHCHGCCSHAAVFTAMSKWGLKERNPALQDVLLKTLELNNTWWEAQDVLNARLRDFRIQLETILGCVGGRWRVAERAQTRNTTWTVRKRTKRRR